MAIALDPRIICDRDGGDRFAKIIPGFVIAALLQRNGEVTMTDSDFHDFLKRQFAHVAIGEFKPGKFSEAQDLYEKAVSTYGQGFKGAYLLQEPGTDRGISVIFWDTVDAMDSNQMGEHHQEILKRMAPLFAHTPTTAIYELVSELQPIAQ